MTRKPSPDRFGDRTIIDTTNFNCVHNKFELDAQLDRVFCGICGEGLNPIWVLRQFMSKENRSLMNIDRLNKIENDTRDKLRCKCEHCNKITGIDRKSHVTITGQLLVSERHYKEIKQKADNFDELNQEPTNRP